MIGATAGLLIWDLDQPSRFHTILLRPNFSSWLTRGAVIISAYGAMLLLFSLFPRFNANIVTNGALAVVAFLAAIYTAFLFAQAKGRDYWQNSLLPYEMTAHSLILGPSMVLLAAELTSFTGDVSFIADLLKIFLVV